MKMRATLVIMLVMVFVFGSFSAASAQRMSIATGSTGGVYYLWGGALAKIWNENVDGVQFNVEATTGQVQNLKLMETGDVEVGMWNVGSAYQGWNGEGWASGHQYRSQRALFAMYPSMYVMVSIKDSGVTSIEDWNGKRIAFGTPGGTVDVVGRNILKVLGIKPAKIVNSGWPDVAGAARDGLVDAIGAIGGQPWPPIVDLNTTHDLVFYRFSQNQIDKLVKAYPYFKTFDLPDGTYDGLDKPYNTLAFWNLVTVSKDVSDEQAYELVKAVFEHRDVLESTHPSTARFLDPKRVVEFSPVPLHPGAIRYFEEIGIDIPDNLRP